MEVGAEDEGQTGRPVHDGARLRLRLAVLAVGEEAVGEVAVQVPVVGVAAARASPVVALFRHLGPKKQKQMPIKRSSTSVAVHRLVRWMMEVISIVGR